MKLYSQYENASMKMVGGDSFAAAIGNVIDRYNIDHVFESGTYLGTGSTTTLAELFERKGIFPTFITVEVNKHFHALAVKNLSKYRFVNTVWGLSTNISDSIEFISTDETIKNHHTIENIFIDDPDDPVQFYLNEISGVEQHKNALELLKSLIALIAGKKQSLHFKQNLMESFIKRYKSKRPLFLLDSSAGTGYFEFCELIRLMDESPFILILDDIHHLKHFRSRDHIEKSDRWSIDSLSETHGWMIATYNV